MGKPKIRPPQNQNPWSIEVKFGMVDYVGKMTPHAKFYVNLTKGAFRQIGEIYANIFSTFFRNSPRSQSPRRILLRNGSNDAVSRKDVPYAG